MNDHKSKIYKAALLHDIGKFQQRTGEVSGKHQLLSEKFAQKWLEDSIVAYIVSRHHEKDLNENPEPEKLEWKLAALVCEADTLASRERQGENTHSQRPLSLIFDVIDIDKDHKPSNLFQPIGFLRPNDEFPFPEDFDRKSAEDRTRLRIDYDDHWEKFEQELQQNNIADLHQDTLLHFYKKYLWCVPSAYYFTVPDISLYEHSRLTAAISVCLFEYLREQKFKNDTPESWPFRNARDLREESAYLLVCGDMTGIQNYIYNIAHTGAMKALKGRSFWLQQIVESTAYRILEDANLFHANLISVAGGKFVLLLPNTDSVKKVLQNVLQHIEYEMLKEYDGDLGFVFGQLEISGADIHGNITEKWDALFKITDAQKQRKQVSQISNSVFFEPFGEQGNIYLCKATKRELGQKGIEVKVGLVPPKDSGASMFTKYTWGNKAAYKIHDKETQKETDEDFISSEQFEAQRFGYQIRNGAQTIQKMEAGDIDVLNLEKIKFFKTVRPDENVLRIMTLNDDSVLNKRPEIPSGFKFYGGNWLPQSPEGDTREFSEIIIDACGIQRLGVLRMDVDNLGQIFKKGLGKKAAFSRLVQLSTLLDFFFACYLNRLQDLHWDVQFGINESKTGKPLKDVLQIVYAGGDDLFIMGVWNVLPDVALWIHDQFESFTGKNPNITLSAGISLFDDKYPLYKAAKYAGEALDKAKSGSKNKICFLETTVSWQSFKVASRLARQWYHWIETEGSLNRSFLRKLAAMHEDYKLEQRRLELAIQEIEDFHRENPAAPRRTVPKNVFSNPKYGPWRWRGVYHLARFEEMVRRRNEKMADEIRNFRTWLFINSSQFGLGANEDIIDVLPLPVLWCDLLMRENK